LGTGPHGRPGVGPATSANPQGAPNGAQPGFAGDASDKPKVTPVYKKWWFWVVVGVSAYVLYSIASEDDTSQSRNGLEGRLDRALLPSPGAPQAGGATLMRW
ncbi:MAG: hypothetical protein M3680_35065, partial [Myxococcota bacterium]|nr:hypothetical protein [Myxococcota bacterium]